MKRIHAFEIHDQSWCPAVFRNQLTEFIQFCTIAFRIYDGIIPLFEKVLLKTNSKQVIDLCSGSSGPWLHLSENTSDVKVVLTDKYPNPKSFERISAKSNGKISYVSESVDATDVPMNLKGMRTIFSGLHHFRPDMVKEILQDAASRRKAIGVFDFAQRNLYSMLTGPIGYPLLVFLLTPFVKPLKLSRLFWTYIFPVAPFVAMWDGVISNLRAYSILELEELVNSIDSKDYKWEIGVEKAPMPGMQITYLLGYPID